GLGVVYTRQGPAAHSCPAGTASTWGTAGGAAAAAGTGRAARPRLDAHARSGVLLGTGLMAVTQLTMVAIMTMTPVFMHDHGHGTSASGAVIAAHVAAMFLPSPVTGRLVDRFGYQAVAAVAAVTLLAAGLIAALAPAGSVVLLAVALALLGLGWNFGLLAGTTLITDAAPVSVRAAVQGRVDLLIAIAAAVGGLASGVVVDSAGYPVLTLSGAALAFTLLAFIAATPPRSRPVVPAASRW
ncbi:MAG: MFS transporter, partial [Frankia sp.]|nr:MFS transporter [Frankia sp.]